MIDSTPMKMMLCSFASFFFFLNFVEKVHVGNAGGLVVKIHIISLNRVKTWGKKW